MPSDGPRIVYFGTPEYSAAALAALVVAKFSVVAAVTQPDRAVGRRQTVTPTPVKAAAQRLGVPIHQPHRLESLATSLAPPPDLGVLFAYGRILPAAVLRLFPHGILNLHVSLLPRYRGPAPVQQALLDGATETGVTIIRLDEKLDHGPVVAQATTPIGPTETAQALLNRLTELGTSVLLEVLPRYLAGKVPLTPQHEADASYTRPLRRQDGRIDWGKPAQHIFNQWRACYSWPGVFTTWEGKRLKLVELKLADGFAATSSPGTVQVSAGLATVSCSAGGITLEQVQLEGRAVMPIAQFLHGYPAFATARLG